MRFCRSPGNPRETKKGPAWGPSSLDQTSKWGDLSAQARRREGRDEAERQEEHRSETVEDPFKVRERHDTHLLVGAPKPLFWKHWEVRAFLI